MDKIKKYEAYILKILNDYASVKYANMPEAENQVIADKENHHYELVTIGWDRDEFVHHCPLHFDIKNGKIWVQVNWTDDDPVGDLESMGVPKSDIVLGWLPEDMREMSEYAVN
ncbi:MAG: XisI protein [Lewinellaceae bacterium]|nr:XisI protein [Saprospiraceae bacterium]MCB9338540.1 XisI protein [Lewinellaceae bacterium]